ncbi:transmembrane emp24 domain-containing protein 5 [Diorhabda carinulata]|uniref:transmembrane emp24 domain-containing protein 5 n=1 Tax=Diorhabda carinulata TaxID=1163345 RepID=UPI0025A0C680|nr:transmembrane emp24 domain-containing protein 5 [Diorhabda carinulata]
MKYLTFCLILSIVNQAWSIEKELTVFIEAGVDFCFHEAVKKGEILDIEYQVIDGGHGDLDINFRFVHPSGRILLTDFKKSENNHRIDVVMDGDYRFCFDNSFSSYNTKTVFFELVVERDDNSEWSDNSVNFNTQDEDFESKIYNAQEILNNIKNHLSKVRSLQDLIKSSEARDRNVAEENFFKVNTFSLVQLSLMLVVGFIQVVMVKSLFDDRSRVHKIWKNLDRGKHSY